MSKQDIKFMAVVLLIAAAIFCMGYMSGYVHVIVNSEAYCVDQGDTLMITVDGHEYQYVVSPAFYNRLTLRGYDADKSAKIHNDY